MLSKQVTKQYKFGEVWGTPQGDLIASADKNFRPSDIEFGDDGALYISDWHNVIIGHMQHNVRDPNRDKKHGRVYRMVYTPNPLQERIAIAGQPIPILLDLLKHPIDGVRYRTRIELSGRDSGDVLAATETWIKQFDATKAADAHPLLEALWLYQQHNRKNSQLLAALLKSPEPHARKAAETVQHFWFNVDFTGGGEVASTELAAAKKPSGVISSTDKLVKVQIGTVMEQLRYDIKDFSVKAGVDVELNFTNNDYVPHNLVVVQPKAGDEIAMAAMAMGADGFATGFRPKSDKIIAASALLDHGKEETLQFKAPSTPGDYEFVCTFPGHSILMRGIMKVTP
jgi:azurin